MFKKHLLASLCLALSSVGIAHGQPGLGTPITPECNREPVAAPSSVDYPSKAHRPLLGQFARTLLTPFRSNVQLLPPQPIVEANPTKADIARMVADGNFSPAEITAAKIKNDEAQAKARQAAVRYLATVDCNYYPEAEAGLIAALRADRSEAVRHEAAVALGTCRGATRRIVEALNLSAMGQDLDGNPAESSERVRQAARSSLNRAVSNQLPLFPLESQMMMPMMPMPPFLNWFDPYALHHADYYLPTFPLAAPLVSPEERHQAETISTNTKSAPAAPTAAPAPRTLADWIQNFTAPREPARSAAPVRKATDSRVRALTPLGSEVILAIPSVQPNPAAPAYLPPYND